MIQPGEIYMADLPQAGRRPVIVLSREDLNRGNFVLAVPLTTARFAVRSSLPNCVPFRAGQFGLTADCVAQGEQVGPVEIQALDTSAGTVGVLDDLSLRDVVKAIGYVMDSDCEPN
jgi:mRNA-degrading endonuclease toxin of MazEF toxin-antitoxin module